MSPNINIDINFLMYSPVGLTQLEHDSGAAKGPNCCHKTLSNKPTIKYCCHDCEDPMGEMFCVEIYITAAIVDGHH